jgi:hypothetical protein
MACTNCRTRESVALALTLALALSLVPAQTPTLAPSGRWHAVGWGCDGSGAVDGVGGREQGCGWEGLGGGHHHLGPRRRGRGQGEHDPVCVRAQGSGGPFQTDDHRRPPRDTRRTPEDGTVIPRGVSPVHSFAIHTNAVGKLLPCCWQAVAKETPRPFL